MFYPHTSITVHDLRPQGHLAICALWSFEISVWALCIERNFFYVSSTSFIIGDPQDIITNVMTITEITTVSLGQEHQRDQPGTLLLLHKTIIQTIQQIFGTSPPGPALPPRKTKYWNSTHRAESICKLVAWGTSRNIFFSFFIAFSLENTRIMIIVFVSL